jgi:hypothetical protein
VLQRVLDEVERCGGAISVGQISERLGMDRSATEGILDELVRMGRLEREDEAASCPRVEPSGGSACGQGCARADGCPLIVRLPPTLSVHRRGCVPGSEHERETR